MTIIQAALLGLVEGLTEFLPVSSTAHLALAAQFLGIAHTEFVKSFEIAIQLGAIAAIVWLYGGRVARDRTTLTRVAIAFIPTGVLGALLYTFVKRHLIGNVTVSLWALALGGVALIVFERWHARRQEGARAVSGRQAFVVGCAQALAMIPGVSRSAATIVGGLAQGISRETIVEFSFLLAVPTMAAATALDLVKSAGTFVAADIPPLTVGFAVAFVSAVATVKFLLAYVRTHTFTAFGVYRILAATAFWLLA